MKKNTGAALQLKPILAYGAICIIWGTTYFAILLGLQQGFTPFIMGGFRFLIAGSIIMLMRVFSAKEKSTVKFVWQNLLLGAVMMGGGQGLIFWAQQYISSGYAAILEASLPLWFILLDGSDRKACLRSKGIIMGLLLGFAGIVLLFLKQLNHPSSGNATVAIYGVMAMLASCVCWVLASLYYTKHFKNTPLLNGLSWQLYGGMFCCGTIGIFTGELTSFNIMTIPTIAWMAVLYLAIAGSVVALMCYHWLLRQWPSAIVGTYAYINPVIAVWLGYFAAAEQVNFIQGIGMVCILVAAFIINKSKAHLAPAK